MITELAMSWNVGGSNDKRHPSQLSKAEREENTQKVKAVVERAGVKRATLLDTKAQGDSLIEDRTNGQRIAKKFGFENAGYVRLNDERLKKIGRGGGEIIFLTQHTKIDSQPIDLGSRQALSTVIDIGKHGLHVVSAYLDDASEDMRLNQANALLSYLSKIDGPTELNLDMNSLRLNMHGASLGDKLKDRGVRIASYILPKLADRISDEPGIRHELKWGAKVVPDMNRREVAPIFENAGYTDVDPQKRPTAPARFPIFGVDQVLMNAGVEADNFELMHTNGASDHLALRYRASYE